MSRIASEIWTRLSGERIRGETLWARRAAPELGDRMLAALDAEGQRHFLVLLRAGEVDVQDSQTRGVRVESRYLAMPGHDAGRYLDISCHDAAGHEAFDLIGGELVARLAAGMETAPECVMRVLGKWRRFWGQLLLRILSREDQLGLFAELWFLSIWMAPRIGPAKAVRRWRGPFGSRHDFEWSGRSVEVKATTSTRGRIHWINGLDQLSPPEAGDLLLFSLYLREEAGATNTLPTLIAECRTQLEGDADSLNEFERALAQSGYSPVHDEQYEKLHLRIIDECLFSVRDDFPRMTLEQLATRILPGIERVEYEINLNGFDHLRIATSAADCPPL